MHLYSSISFQDGESGAQYYRKSQAPAPSPGPTPTPSQHPAPHPPQAIAGMPSIPNLPVAGIPTPKDPTPPQYPQGSQLPPSQYRMLNFDLYST